ncbi:MAG: S41 family peptidase [Flavobacteriaceae bacterium]|nr:S41 family peptidase [Flavobacteriaceae bacterium]
MRKFTQNLLLAIVLLTFTTSCFNDDRDDNVILASEINDFVWKGMNAVYLYKDNIPDLANDRFSSNLEYGNYLNSFSTPEDLFESVIYQRETVDRFSWITDDYIALEQLFSGVSKSNGMEFSLFFAPNSSTEVIGVIRLVLPNSEADINNLQRGDIFYAVDGSPLTESNFSTLLNQDTYTLNLATFNDNGTPETTDDTIDPITESVTISKVPYTENPVFRTEIIDVAGENVGYLMYNGFTSNFDNQLNSAFGNFLSNNVQHLVLDLRYNPGGSVNTATLLGSMITGQFNGEVFAKLIYNNDLQEHNSSFNFTNSLNDGSAINSLNLDKVYVLTTERSASASEMVINSLRAYISSVIQIGTNTTGKSQASITVYDSPELTNKDDINPNHLYAMQPLVAIGVNKNDEVVPSTGLIPTIPLEEYRFNYGVLGNANEPLLAAALADILGTGRMSYPVLPKVELLGDSNDFLPFEKGGMIIDKKLPKEAFKRLEFNQ